jgi:hypothetical protein
LTIDKIFLTFENKEYSATKNSKTFCFALFHCLYPRRRAAGIKTLLIKGVNMQEKKELDIGISKYKREKIIEHLKYGFANDYLEQDVFEKRLSIAINTQNRKDLQSLVEDIPEIKEIPLSQNETLLKIHFNKDQVKAEGTINSILGSTERKGPWKPPQKLNISVIMGEAKIDFTQAVFPPGVIEIEIFCLMGEINIIVPPGVNVDNDCMAILGSANNKSDQCEYKNSPTLRITGKVIMGALYIKTPKESLIKLILKRFGLDYGLFC